MKVSVDKWILKSTCPQKHVQILAGILAPLPSARLFFNKIFETIIQAFQDSQLEMIRVAHPSLKCKSSSGQDPINQFEIFLCHYTNMQFLKSA